jgi:hypothetical protein
MEAGNSTEGPIPGHRRLLENAKKMGLSSGRHPGLLKLICTTSAVNGGRLPALELQWLCNTIEQTRFVKIIVKKNNRLFIFV